MASTAADILIDDLQPWGVEVIFGLPPERMKIAATVTADKVRELE